MLKRNKMQQQLNKNKDRVKRNRKKKSRQVRKVGNGEICRILNSNKCRNNHLIHSSNSNSIVTNISRDRVIKIEEVNSNMNVEVDIKAEEAVVVMVAIMVAVEATEDTVAEEAMMVEMEAKVVEVVITSKRDKLVSYSKIRMKA